MSCKRSACLRLLMVLILCQQQVDAKSLSSLQSLSRLLQDNFERSYGSEEVDHERGELVPTDSLDPDNQWIKNQVEKSDGAHMNEIALQQLLTDPAGLQHGYRQRSKKGYSRGCFGVKLDRIGSFSGLGC